MYDAINIYYKNYLAEIGGIETATYNIAKKYGKKKDILFLIGDGHPAQLKRLSEVANVEIYKPNKQYFCKKLFITYETYVPKNIHAEINARVSHGDLFKITENGWNPPIDNKVNEDYGVSVNTCKSVEWYMKHKCTLCPNPIVVPEKRELLRLISPQRMTWEKGKGRIKEIARQLDEHSIPYQWLIVCNEQSQVLELNNPNIIWVKSRLDITPFIYDAHYLVLVSDCEGSPLSPQESLLCNTPVIVTDLPCYKTMGIDDKCGFILDMDLKNLDVEEIYRKKDKFKINWQPEQDIWGDILLDGKVEREHIQMSFIKVKATKAAKEYGLKISEIDRIPEENEVFEVLEERLPLLLGNNPYNAKFVEVVQEIVLEDKPKKKAKKGV